ncbi:hexameric tyrosine-coordinated heme protein [Escherichia coli]|nr:hexameric tyrosine-coordinated heme protein [Escherichia coli]MDY9212510.1 hexameric tyrosine-coordinated heme protein [Escherichia coli]MDY9267083.1 hexameric tyrosine-coordinated heme protein [Escherichia coli]MDY9321866.1 hexameric tyrosine-coordinated heme protein [Escherichia coli]MDY9326735.1 hexameric tyrosine-coordinated heme protein [Escherichia coli]
MSDNWLSTLRTRTPQEGFELAVILSRRGVKTTQPDTDILKKLRPEYANNAESLISVSQVIAINFQTIAIANGYWMNNNI